MARLKRRPTRTPLHNDLLRLLTPRLSIDRALPLEQVRQRPEFARFACLLDQPLEEVRTLFAYTRLRTVELPVTHTVGSRHAVDTAFLCATARVSGYRDSTLRQLAGLGALRYGLGLGAHEWHLTALYRNEEAIPDARIGVFHGCGKGITRIAVEWDSGSAMRSYLLEKIDAYAKLAGLQIWAVATRRRAETIEQCLGDRLPIGSYLVFVVDWRDGQLVDVGASPSGSIHTQLAKHVSNRAPWYETY